MATILRVATRPSTREEGIPVRWDDGERAGAAYLRLLLGRVAPGACQAHRPAHFPLDFDAPIGRVQRKSDARVCAPGPGTVCQLCRSARFGHTLRTMSVLMWLVFRVRWAIFDWIFGIPSDPYEVDKRLAIRAAKILTRHRTYKLTTGPRKPDPHGGPFDTAEIRFWKAPSELGRERAEFILRNGLRGPKGVRVSYTPHLVPHIIRTMARERDDEFKQDARDAALVDDGPVLQAKWEAAVKQIDIDHANAEDLIRRAKVEHLARMRQQEEAIEAENAKRQAEYQAEMARIEAASLTCSLCQGGVFCAEHVREAGLLSAEEGIRLARGF